MKIHQLKAETIRGSDTDARTTLIGSNSKTLMRENDFWNSFLKQNIKKKVGDGGGDWRVESVEAESGKQI